MTWFNKKALSDKLRLENNILRLENLSSYLHDLAYSVVSSQSGGYYSLKSILGEKVVLGRPNLKAKLEEALIGENDQKVALDAPTRFQQIMLEAEQIISNEIETERRKLIY